MADRLTTVSIVIPVHNRKNMTLNCLRQLTYIDKEGTDITIIVVDDGSTDGTSQAIEIEYPGVVVLHGDGNLWWSGATNKGVMYAIENKSDYVLTLNDDIEFERDFLILLLKTAKENPNVIVCAVICNLMNQSEIVSAGRYAKGFLGYDYSGHLRGEDVSMLPEKDYESDIESGYAMLIPAIIFQKVGLFDTRKFPQNMGDMDFVLRAKKTGVKLLINPKAILYATNNINYFHSQILNSSIISILKSFFELKSTVNLKIRWNFCWRHTPYYLGWLAYGYFISRMCIALVLKIIFPTNVLRMIIKKRKNLPI